MRRHRRGSKASLSSHTTSMLLQVSARSGVADGAWGLRFPSLEAAAHVLVDAPQWPEVDLDIHHLAEPNGDRTSEWDSSGMRVALPTGGVVQIVWPFAVTLSLSGHPIPECVVQPFLTTAAASIALRRGLQPFHAGAFELDGRAWAVLGAKEAGKSSTLALADQRGSAIVTDDLLVVEGDAALSGPRCIDLRAEPAQVLNVGENLGIVGLRERWRVRVGPCPATIPLAGFIVPSWGDDQIDVLPPIARLQVLFSNSALQGVTMNDPDQYLRLASLPMISWVRPKSWLTAHRSFDSLLVNLARSTRKDEQ
jgi:hypothetical protein